MRRMRGAASTTMSHAPMRAASTPSALAEARRDDPVEVIETLRRVRLSAARPLRLVDRRRTLDSDLCSGHIRGPPTRSRIDAVAGRTRVRRVGSEPGERSRCGAAFRWIYLPVALYRGLPADPGLLPSLLRPRISGRQRLDDLRDALGLRHLRADARTILAPGRDDCGADARAVAGFHHVFVAGDERRSDIVRDDLRGGDAGGSDVGVRHSIIKLDANGGMADVRSRGRVLDDHPSHQCRNPCRLRAVHFYGAT